MPSVTIVYASTTAAGLQAAWDALQGRPITIPITLDAAPGTYAESLVLTPMTGAGLITIQGDTRAAAGEHFATAGAITKSGSDCTLTLVNTPPADFTTADHIVVGGAASAGNVGRFPIVAINTGAKTVTYTNAAGVAEAVRRDTRVIFCPDRVIDFTGQAYGVEVRCGEQPTLRGFTIVSTAPGATGIYCQSTGGLRVSQCAVFGVASQGYFAAYGATLEMDARCSAVKSTDGFLAGQSATVLAGGAYAANCSTGFRATAGSLAARNAIAASNNIGIRAHNGGHVDAVSAVASDNGSSGFFAEDAGVTRADGSTAVGNGRGYYALWQGLVLADNTSANASNPVNYLPSPSGTQGPSFGLIRFS